jgi:N-acetylmuramoyl-L-alanine amidase
MMTFYHEKVKTEMNITSCPSSNFNDRPAGCLPSLIILHYTGTKTAEEAKSRFLDKSPADTVGRIAPHYLIDGAGKVTRFVEEDKRAWHAGASMWQGQEDINGLSIGIEIWNSGHEHDLEDYRTEQMDSLINLIEDIRRRWTIPNIGILAHSDVAPQRKLDPGEKFPWSHLAAKGVGLFPRIMIEDKDVGSRLLKDRDLFIKSLHHYGYDSRVDETTLITAFQRHFLPHIFSCPERVGKPDLETCAAFASLFRQSKA